MRACVASAVVGLLVAAVSAAAAEQAPLGPTSPWALERLTLVDGRTLEGLALASEDDASNDVDFIEVVRRPGRPMHLITRRLPAAAVHSLERLPADDHAALEARVEAFRSETRREREATAAVRLTRSDSDEEGLWRYEGPLFDLESSAGQPLTRLAVVRLEDLLVAFESLVPPPDHAPTRRRLSVRLCGSQPEYAQLQADHGISAAHPAFYLPARALLVAGGDASVVLEQARAATDGLDATAQLQKAYDQDVTAGLQRLDGKLEAQGIPASQRAEILARVRIRWQREKAAVLTRVDHARAINAAHLNRAKGDLLTSLAHEAWHAYADLRLAGDGALPAWLDEGLAQVFETGLLEAGAWRLDAPDPERLARLGALLADRHDGLLATLVDGGDGRFVIGHGTAAATSREAYLLSWGLAYDLALNVPVLSSSALATLSLPEARDRTDGVTRFERLVGMPVDRFEAAWRTRMLTLARTPRRNPSSADQADAPPAPMTAAAPRAAPDR